MKYYTYLDTIKNAVFEFVNIVLQYQHNTQFRYPICYPNIKEYKVKEAFDSLRICKTDAADLFIAS